MPNFNYPQPPTPEVVLRLAQEEFAKELQALGQQFWHEVLDDRGSLVWDNSSIDKLAGMYEEYGLTDEQATALADETYAEGIKRKTQVPN